MTAAAAKLHQDPLLAAAQELQRSHRVGNKPPVAVAAWANLSSLPKWMERLQAACAVAEPEATKAAEWFLDNHYQVQRTLREIREDLPLEFYRRLPSLDNPGQEGLPRVYCLAHGMLSASHFQLASIAAAQFVATYQLEAPLTIGELWAFPTMLRLACIEILVAASLKIFPASSLHSNRRPFPCRLHSTPMSVWRGRWPISM